MAVLLGLTAAFAYGLSDFIAALVSRRVHYGVVGLVSYATGFVALGAIVLVSMPPAPTLDAILWGAASGVGGGAGTLALYRGLARGRMGVVAPISGLVTAALPVLVGVILGDRPSALAWIGIAAALPAIWLVSMSADDVQPDGQPGAKMLSGDVVDGLIAGAGFALLLVGLGLAGDGAGLWPVAVSDAVGLAMIAVVLVALGDGFDRTGLSGSTLAGGILAGALGATGVAAYFLSTQQGLLSIVAVLTSLYPAVTVVLAATLLHEAIGRRQLVGLALAAGAVVLIVLG